MNVIIVVLIVLVALGAVGAATVYVVVTRGMRRLRQWDEEKGLTAGAMATLDEAKSLPIVQQITGVTPTYRYLDVETATTRQIVAAVRPSRQDPVIGSHAEFVLDTIGRIGFYREGFDRLLDHEFGRTSLTWARFHAPVEDALAEEKALSVRMANRIQVFDSAMYQRLSASAPVAGTAESDQLSAMNQTLEDLSMMRETATRLMTGLERLHAELSQMSASHTDEDCSDVLDELQRLSEDAKLYA